MNIGRKVLLGAVLGAGMMTASVASAATFIVDVATNSPLPGKTYTTFNNRTLGNTTQQTGTGITVSFTGGGAFVTGSSTNNYSAPILTGGNGAQFGQADGVDTTTFVSSGIGSATLTLGDPSLYLGFLWGSIDPYNSLTINTADGMSQIFTGAQIIALGATGSRYINFTSTSKITSFTITSTINSFELDNVALTASVPEPATWAMMLAGFGAVGFAMRRRQKAVARVTYAA